MKKLYRSLLTIAISAPLLSGCSFFETKESGDFPVETKKITELSLRDYTKTVLLNESYNYDGKVFVLYEDETEKEVTSYCTFESVDTSTVGDKSFKVKYETTEKIYSKIGHVNVVDSISLTSISVTNYTDKVKMNETYTFNGKVTAKYEIGGEKDVTKDAVVSSLDTSTPGMKKVNVSYTEGNVTKSVGIDITVQKYLVEIVVSGYQSSYIRNSSLDKTVLVQATYSDGTTVDVTSKTTVDFSSVDLSTLGTYEVKVSYTEDETTSEVTFKVLVVDELPKLQSIEASGYNGVAEKGIPYNFDGVVMATFNKGEPVNVTSDCSFDLDTSTVGEKTLKISCKDPNWDITKTCEIKINVVISVTGINCDSSLTFAVNESTKINASVVPSNATNRELNFTSNDESIASVDGNGNVTAKAKGNTTIVVASVDKPEISKSVEITVLDDPKLVSISASGYTTSVDKDKTYTFDGKVMASFSSGDPKDVTSSCSFEPIKTSSSGNETMTISYTDPVWGNTATCSITIEVISHVTGISVSDSISVGVNSTSSLNASVLPSDAKNKSLTYSSSNTSIATVSSAGVVTGKATGTANITITSVDTPSVTKNVSVTVSDKDEWTILLYVCGANLESGTYYDQWSGQYVTPSASQASGLASADIDEILSVKGQPDNVNIVIETGGANVWQSGHSYSVDKTKLQRWEVKNKSLVKKETLSSYTSMGNASTLQSFIEWGIDNYPANKTGLIFWDHGGGMSGCCFDERKNDDGLTHDEVVSAVSGAFSKKGVDKFEFVGYDCCLMQMMEIAEFNSPYFNYQVTSQELENGTGWAYDRWVDDLYRNESTETILKAIVDGFISVNGGKNGTGGYDEYGQYYPADQTLSVVNLKKISAFKTAWESMASATKSKITSSNKSKFRTNIVEKTKYFGGDYYTDYYEYDCYDFLLKLESNTTFNPGGDYIQNAKDAFDDMIVYNLAQLEGSADAHGLSCYIGKTYNSSKYTHFTNWSSLVSTVRS